MDQMPKLDKRKSNNYKALKESFVSNLSGGSIWEINEISLVVTVSLIVIPYLGNSILILLGQCSTLVCPAISAALLHTLHNSCNDHRLSY
jgi:hypothetical protein